MGRIGSYLIILNWNGWKDTIECLESVFRLNASALSVVVCDNASADGSLEKIKAWASGELLARVRQPRAVSLDSSAFPKADRLLRIDPRTGGIGKRRLLSPGTCSYSERDESRLCGRKNVGFVTPSVTPNCQYFWMLNNDTVVEPDALSAMVLLMQERPRSVFAAR